MAKVTIEDVKKLREMTGAGVVDCKRALEEADGDIDKAVEILRKKGIAKAQKLSSRKAEEGLIEAYIHYNGRVGSLVEVNCETDFVARLDEFKNLAKDIAMHVAGMNPKYVREEDIPEDVLKKEKETYLEQARAQGKTGKEAEKFAENMLGKFIEETVLYEQPFVKDVSKKVRDVIAEVSAKVGENIRVKRFVRFELGGE